MEMFGDGVYFNLFSVHGYKGVVIAIALCAKNVRGRKMFVLGFSYNSFRLLEKKN